MARAAFRVKELRAELIKCTLRQLSVECTTIVSPKASSILRNTTAEGIRNLSLQDVCNEWKQQTLLSPRQAYLQKWNRSVNRHSSIGKNVAFDLDLEHDNNHLKEAMRKLGPNVSESSVSRICGSLKIARETIENISRECQVMKRSGKHFVASAKKDNDKLVENLILNKAFLFSNGRKYKTFTDCKRSALHNLNMADMCRWINQHKHEIKIGRTAR